MAEFVILVGETWQCDACGWESPPVGARLPQSPLVVDDIMVHTRSHGATFNFSGTNGSLNVAITEIGTFSGRRFLTVPVAETELQLDAGRG